MIHSGLDDIGQVKAIAGKVIQEVRLWGLVEFFEVYLHLLCWKPTKLLSCLRIKLLYYWKLWNFPVCAFSFSMHNLY